MSAEKPGSGTSTTRRTAIGSETKPDAAVNHPAHYNHGRIEVIDAIEDWKLGFHEGNAVKYIARAARKGNRRQDLEKAVWYLNRVIEGLSATPEAERK